MVSNMTYIQAKLAASDFTVVDKDKLLEAASVLLARLDASDDDIYDATELAYRARKIKG
jgi:hypothetical protein